jgi:hypothetical protein
MVYICIGMIIKVYRYQSGIQRLYIREGQIIQWLKKREKTTSDALQNTTQKTKD